MEIRPNLSASKNDALVKSRRPDENRGPDILKVHEKTGFRLSPE
jgi:hypothetical protein